VEGSHTSLDESRTRCLDESEPNVPSASLAPGTLLGRYVVLGELGRGAMGRVYRAYDPRLGREVAIKQMGRAGGKLSREGAARMLREAQAMAKLAHPNVVPVYDVEGDGADLFIAMELIDGGTLAEWLDEHERGWPDIVEVFRGAGTGLAVAHEAGLVHRDFKPGNVMLGSDGRPRVMDFGLARLDSSVASASRSSDVPEVIDDEALTRVGTVMGTPAFMAPEQHDGHEDVGPPADQYAFCVALWQGLYGKRPFSGKDTKELAERKRSGPPPQPSGRRVPPWLHRIVVRGLAVQPTDRWPTMRALVEALGRDPALRRRQLLTGSSVVLGLSGVVAFASFGTPAASQPCESEVSPLADVWDEGVRASMVTAIEGTGLSYAPRTAEIVTAQLSDYVDRWVASHLDACQATHVRHEQSADVLDRRMACLQRSKAELVAIVDLFSGETSASTVERAQSVVSGLPSLARCSDVEDLRAGVPPPEDPAVAKHVEALDAKFAALAVWGRSGRAEEALESIDALLEEAAQTEYLPLMSRAHRTRGRLLEKSGQYEAAAEAIAQAYVTAVEADDDRGALVASTNLAFVYGDRTAKTEDAQIWLDVAGALARRVDPGGEGEAHYLNNLGNVMKIAGRLDEAIAAYDRAAEIYRKEYGEDDSSVAMVLGNSAIALNEHRRPNEAKPRLERALEIETEVYGPDHPRVGMTLTNLGLVLYALHRHPEALEHHTRARDIFAASWGEEHPYFAAALANMGMAMIELHRFDEAEPLLVRSYAIKKAMLGEGHRGLVPQITNLGLLAMRRGDPKGAIGYMQQSRDILVAHHGEEHHFVAMTDSNLGSLYSQIEQYDDARAHIERALAYYHETDGADAPSLAAPLTGMAELEVAMGHDAEAERLYERIIGIEEKHSLPEIELAWSRFSLAKLRAKRPEHAAGSRDAVERALTVFEERDEDRADEARRWLAEHPAPR